jgi:alpha-tubulin suppressor-like RCC1 family protein
MAEAEAPRGNDDNSKTDFVDSGPPPDMRQRNLIFDAFEKIVGRTKGRQKGRGRRTGQNRGTFLFTWGAGYHGQLGRKFVRGQKKYSAVPVMVEELKLVVRQVTCGGLHTALVTEHGDVYTWGDGRKGQLGLLSGPSLTQVPRLVDSLTSVHIVQVACGMAHTVALADNGVMYSWGWSKFGQTGHGDRQTVKVPKRIEACTGVVAVACGNKHSMAITGNGIALSWGCGEHGQTGQPRQTGAQLMTDGDKLVPTKVDELADKKIASISCGSIHSCFVTKDGELYICGFGEYFYPNETQHFVFKPKLIEMPELVKQVACGQSHNVALSVKGNVYTWGSGEYGQLGYGIKGNISTPRLVLNDKQIAQVSAGRYHSFALSKIGALYSWGCGENGQLGLNSDENIALPTVVTHILGTVVGQVSCGEHHTAVLTSAPWNKLSQDTTDWLAAAKIEHEQKRVILKKTHRGLTRKDLTRVKEDMKKWNEAWLARKREASSLEHSEEQRDIASIMYSDNLRESVLKDMDEKGKTMKLPQVSDDTAPDPEEDPRAAGEPGAVRLPKVHKKKAHTTKSTATHTTDTPYRRATSAAQAQTSELGSTQAPFTRTAFLKETAQMVRRMKSVVQEKGEASNQKELQRTINMVFTFRKEYDNLRNLSRKLSRDVEELKKEQKLLTKSSALSKETYAQCYEQLKSLEMQLNTVTIKIAETSENRKNYELNISHLKEEDFENFNQLKALRKQNQDNNSFFKKMDELRCQALEEKEQAEAEHEEFQKEIQMYQKFVKEQLLQFQSILGIVRAQNEKREKAKDVRQEKVRSKIAQRIDKLQQEAETADKEASGLTSRLTSLELKLRHFEDSFQKITAATGLTNPEAIVNKFAFKGEIEQQLREEIEDKGALIAELKTKQAELEGTLKEAKAGFIDDSWHDVEKLAEKNRQSAFEGGVNQQAMSKVTQRLVFAQEGLTSLLSEVEKTCDNTPSEEASTGELWSEEQSTKIFDKINNAVKVLLDVEKERNARLEEEVARKKLEEEENKKKLDDDGKFSSFPLDHATFNELRSNDYEEPDADAQAAA